MAIRSLTDINYKLTIKRFNKMVNYFEEKMWKSGLPVPPKKEYDGLCEVADEFNTNEKYLLGELMKKAKANMKEYRSYAKADHSNIGEHFHSFGSIDMGGDYQGHIGMEWPSPKIDMRYCVTKDFSLKDENIGMTIGKIRSRYGDEPMLAFFTDWMLEGLGDSTRIGKDLLFLNCNGNGLISYCSDEVRWLFHDGLAYGFKHCRYCVFHEFSDRYKFPSGKLTQAEIEELNDAIWNEMN